MRRLISLLIIIALMLLCLAGCSSLDNIKIEDYEWELSRVIVLEDETVLVLASNNETDISNEAKKIDIELIADNGSITITDHLNNCTYNGTYKRTRNTPAGTDYEITIDGNPGYATAAMTTYADGSRLPTLPISLGKYTLQLYAKI